jgi:hypothetical protein
MAEMITSEASGIVCTVVCGAVKFLVEGNYKSMLATASLLSVDSIIVTPEGRKINGQHIGQRHVGDCRKSVKTLYSPRYSMFANGQGQFISPELRYTGLFITNRFYGKGVAEYTFRGQEFQRYDGEFYDGSRCGNGTMYLRDKEGLEYKYFTGSWKDDQPWTGTYFGEDGTPVRKRREGLDTSVDAAESLPALAVPSNGANSPLHGSQKETPQGTPHTPTAGSGSAQPSPPPSRSPTVELTRPRVVFIVVQGTSMSSMLNFQKADELAAVLRTSDGRLISGKHSGPREIVPLRGPEFVPYISWCCFFCCRQTKTAYYLRPIGNGTFTNMDDPACPITYTGPMLDGRMMRQEVKSQGESSSAHDMGRIKSANASPFATRPAAAASPVPTPATPDPAPASPTPATPPPAPRTPTPVPTPASPTPRATPVDPENLPFPAPAQAPTRVTITGTIRLLSKLHLRHGKKLKGAVMAAEMQLADGTWVAGYHEGAREKFRPKGHVRTVLRAHGKGSFHCATLAFVYEGMFIEDRMEELHVKNAQKEAGGHWVVPLGAQN